MKFRLCVFEGNFMRSDIIFYLFLIFDHNQNYSFLCAICGNTNKLKVSICSYEIPLSNLGKYFSTLLL